MNFLRKTTALFSALAVSVTMLSAVPAQAANSYPVSVVSTEIGELYKDGYVFEQFELSGIAVSELYWLHKENGSDKTFGDVQFYRITDDDLEKFRKTGKLSYKKVTVDSELRSVSLNIGTSPVTFGNWNEEQSVVGFDREENKLYVYKKVDPQSFYFAEKYTMIDGSVFTDIEEYKFTDISGDRPHKLTLTDPEGKSVTANYNYAGGLAAPDMICCIENSGSKTAMYRIDHGLKKELIWSSDVMVAADASYATEDNNTFIINKRQSTDMRSSFELVRFDASANKETTILKSKSGESYVSVNACYITGKEPVEFVLLVYKVNSQYKYELSRAFKYNIKTGKLKQIDLGSLAGTVFSSPLYFNLDNNYTLIGEEGNMRMLDLTACKAMDVKYDHVETLTFSSAFVYNKDSKGNIKNAAILFSNGTKLSVSSVAKPDSIRQRYTEFFGDIFYSSDEKVLICKDGKAWFTDTDYKQLSAKFKADEVRNVGVGLYAYSLGGKNYFAVTKEEAQTTVSKPAKVSGLKVSAKTQSTLTLKWNEVKGADGYRVEIYKNGKWTKVGTTKKLTATVKKLTAGNSYKLRVRAYVKTGSSVTYGSASSVSAATKK